jgi:hypothetical protein
MTITLSDIRFDCEQILPQGSINDPLVIKLCNQAQVDFMFQVYVPGTTTLAINTTSLSYVLSPTTIEDIRRIRLQSDITNLINRPYNPSYTLYNGVFEVPTPFTTVDTLLIDYYARLKTFTAMTDTIDLEDRFKPLYTSYIEAQYYLTPEAVAAMPGRSARYVPWLIAYQQYSSMYDKLKKQVTDYYTNSIGTQKPNTSGW